MIIIGFVVAVMIFSSFAIVFNNSGNIQNTSNKQILNLPEKSFTSNVVNKYQIDLSNLPSGNGLTYVLFEVAVSPELSRLGNSAKNTTPPIIKKICH